MAQGHSSSWISTVNLALSFLIAHRGKDKQGQDSHCPYAKDTSIPPVSTLSDTQIPRRIFTREPDTCQGDDLDLISKGQHTTHPAWTPSPTSSAFYHHDSSKTLVTLPATCGASTHLSWTSPWPEWCQGLAPPRKSRVSCPLVWPRVSSNILLTLGRSWAWDWD